MVIEGRLLETNSTINGPATKLPCLLTFCWIQTENNGQAVSGENGRNLRTSRATGVKSYKILSGESAGRFAKGHGEIQGPFSCKLSVRQFGTVWRNR